MILTKGINYYYYIYIYTLNSYVLVIARLIDETLANLIKQSPPIKGGKQKEQRERTQVGALEVQNQSGSPLGGGVGRGGVA
jgi:hypothetical protein